MLRSRGSERQTVGRFWVGVHWLRRRERGLLQAWLAIEEASGEMQDPPINVKLSSPTLPDDNWPTQERTWLALNEQVSGHPSFNPLTIKAAYVIGIIHDICEAVDVLIASRLPREVKYIPAYAMFSSGVEILGRCINGNDDVRGSVADLRAGFEWLTWSGSLGASQVLPVVTTATAAYSVEDLVALRHFATHGQATAKALPQSIDFELLAGMPPILAVGLERYWSELNTKDTCCDNLAKANVIAFRQWPVFKVWAMLQGDGTTGNQTITDVFGRFVWHV
jgi:hypothetical protein